MYPKAYVGRMTHVTPHITSRKIYIIWYSPTCFRKTYEQSFKRKQNTCTSKSNVYDDN